MVVVDRQRQYRTKTQIQLGMYSEFFELWFAFFPRDRFLILRQEDIGDNPRAIYDRVTAHLNISRLPDSAIFRDDNRPNSLQYKSTMLDETRVLLNKFYAPYNEKLAAMEHNDRFNYHRLAPGK